MSKEQGKKISVKFTLPLTEISTTRKVAQEKQDGNWTAYGTSSYGIDKAIDGNIWTYWRSMTTGNYIQIERYNTILGGIKIYKGSSYRPLTYDIKVSNDGITYVSIKTGSFIATTGWETITLDEVETNYIRVYFTYSSMLYIYEMALLVMEYDHQGSVGDFEISGQEYLYVDGPYNNGELINKLYEVKTMSRHPTIPNAILLDIKDGIPFNAVVGGITVKYDQTKGNLQGTGGAVKSFEETFIPTDLIEQGNPRIREYIKPNISNSTIESILIEKINTYETEYIKPNISNSTIELIYVDNENP